MSMTYKMTCAFLEAKGVKYLSADDQKSIRISYNVDNKDTIAVRVFFDDDDRTIALRSFDYVKFPAGKIDTMYKICSELNKQYRWVKFYVDEQDNTITLADDAIVQVDSCGDEILELVLRMINIGDESYPKFMKSIWQ